MKLRPRMMNKERTIKSVAVESMLKIVITAKYITVCKRPRNNAAIVMKMAIIF